MAHEYLKHPKDQKFYKNLALLTCIVALNSQYWQWYSMPSHKMFRIQRIVIIIFAPVILISEVAYLIAHYKEHEFSSLSAIFAITPITIIVNVKIVLAQTPAFKIVMVDFMDKIHLYNVCTIFKTDFFRKTLLIAEKQFRMTLYLYMALSYLSYLVWQITPIINNIQENPDLNNITTRLEIFTHVWLPFDYEFDFYIWSAVQVMMSYVGFVGITVIFCFDSINLAFIYHLTGHINIMKHFLRTEINDDMSEEDVREKLVELTKYYQFIRETFKKVETAFGVNIAAIYALNLLMGGIVLYQLLTSGADAKILITYGSIIPLYVGILLIMSYLLETADDIPDLVYNLKWESMSISNQKMIIMLLCQVQPTLEFKAAFNLKTGVQPAINIIKTTFSYYVMIKARM